MPPHHLGGMEYAWECPASSVSGSLIATIDLFWLCHTRVPGWDTSIIQRTGLPDRGAVGDQDNWLMNAFMVIESAYYEYWSDSKQERELQAKTDQARANIAKQGANG